VRAQRHSLPSSWIVLLAHLESHSPNENNNPSASTPPPAAQLRIASPIVRAGIIPARARPHPTHRTLSEAQVEPPDSASLGSASSAVAPAPWYPKSRVLQGTRSTLPTCSSGCHPTPSGQGKRRRRTGQPTPTGRPTSPMPTAMDWWPKPTGFPSGGLALAPSAAFISRTGPPENNPRPTRTPLLHATLSVSHHARCSSPRCHVHAAVHAKDRQ